MDGVRDELAGEKAVSTGLKVELETAAERVQTIVVDAVLSARAELMGEFKRGEHSSWDPDEEDDEEEAPVVESPKQQEEVVLPELGEPAAGAEGVVPEPEDAAATEDPAASAEDIAKD